MAPADQRLDTGRRRGLQVHRGLQVQLDLVLGGQRVLQFGEQRQPVGGDRVLAGLVGGDRHLVPLGVVQRQRRPADQLDQLGPAGLGDHDADRDLDGEPDAGHLHRPADLLDQLAGPAQGLRQRAGRVVQRRRRVGERGQGRDQHRELVVAGARDQLVLAGQRGEAAGHQLEHPRRRSGGRGCR